MSLEASTLLVSPCPSCLVSRRPPLWNFLSVVMRRLWAVHDLETTVHTQTLDRHPDLCPSPQSDLKCGGQLVVYALLPNQSRPSWLPLKSKAALCSYSSSWTRSLVCFSAGGWSPLHACPCLVPVELQVALSPPPPPLPLRVQRSSPGASGVRLRLGSSQATWRLLPGHSPLVGVLRIQREKGRGATKRPTGEMEGLFYLFTFLLFFFFCPHCIVGQLLNSVWLRSFPTYDANS